MRLVQLATTDITKVKWVRYYRKKPDPPPKYEFVNSLYIFSTKGVFVLKGQNLIRYFLKRIGVRYRDVFARKDRSEIVTAAAKKVNVSFEFAYVEDKAGYLIVRNINGILYHKRKKYRTLP